MSPFGGNRSSKPPPTEIIWRYCPLTRERVCDGSSTEQAVALRGRNPSPLNRKQSPVLCCGPAHYGRYPGIAVRKIRHPHVNLIESRPHQSAKLRGTRDSPYGDLDRI